MKHIFLILNYNTKQMTTELVKYIISNNFYVLVVDNGSSDNSFDFLSKTFKNNKLVSIISTCDNLGFARGNNFGYKYILDNFNDFDYIHCINSDIEFFDIKDFCKVIECQDDKYFVIGPNVLHNNLKTSPMYIRNLNTLENDIKKDLKIYEKKIKKHKVFSKFKIFYNNYMKMMNSFNQTENFIFPIPKTNEYYILNGSYLIFTKNYTNKFAELFDPRTFLYYEEEFLFYKLKKENHAVLYMDEISIVHNEGVSTNKNIINKYINLKASLEILLDEVEGSNK